MTTPATPSNAPPAGASAPPSPQIVYVPAPSGSGLPAIPDFGAGVWLAVLFVATIAWRMAPDIVRWFVNRGEEPARKAAQLEADARKAELAKVVERIDRLEADFKRQLEEMAVRRDEQERQLRADVQRSIAAVLHENPPMPPRPSRPR